MDISFSAPISGIKTSIRRQDIVAHDTANVNTKGFGEHYAVQTERRPQGTEIAHIGKTPNSDKEYSNTSIAEETKEQIQNKSTLSANIRVLKAKDEMLGEIIDLVG